MSKRKLKKRFEFEKFQSSLSSSTSLIIDKETGIEYLLFEKELGAGLTVLLDRHGKPKINEDYK